MELRGNWRGCHDWGWGRGMCWERAVGLGTAIISACSCFTHMQHMSCHRNWHGLHRIGCTAHGAHDAHDALGHTTPTCSQP